MEAFAPNNKKRSCPFQFCQRAHLQTGGLLIDALDGQVENKIIWSQSKLISGVKPKNKTFPPIVEPGGKNVKI